jgi:hypothetical protein
MKLRALVRDRESIERFLRHQNLWTDPARLNALADALKTALPMSVGRKG